MYLKTKFIDIYDVKIKFIQMLFELKFKYLHKKYEN